MAKLTANMGTVIHMYYGIKMQRCYLANTQIGGYKSAERPHIREAGRHREKMVWVAMVVELSISQFTENILIME